jgi:hypothetical protein
MYVPPYDLDDIPETDLNTGFSGLQDCVAVAKNLHVFYPQHLTPEAGFEH